MLVLTRRTSEALMINDEIIVRVLSVDEGCSQVKLGIEAPKTVEVHREEVYNRINEQAPGPTIIHKRRFRAVLP